MLELLVSITILVVLIAVITVLYVNNKDNYLADYDKIEFCACRKIP